MGRSKPLLPLGDTDFLGTILATIRSCEVVDGPIVVVRRDEDDALAQRLRAESGFGVIDVIVDGAGQMLESIRAGEARLGEAGGALVWPVDAPATRRSTVAALCSAAMQEPGRAVLPVVQGADGHPVYVPRGLLAGPGEASTLREILAAAAPRRLALDDPLALLNVNTPEDYQTLLATFAVPRNV